MVIKTSVKNEYMMLNYFDDRKYFIFSVNVYCIQAEKLKVYRGWSRQIFLLRKPDNTHISLLKICFLLNECNSRNFLSEIITNNLEKLLIKIYRFQWDFSLQILSHCLCILNQTLSYVISQRALLCHSICCVLMYILIYYYLYKF